MAIIADLLASRSLTESSATCYITPDATLTRITNIVIAPGASGGSATLSIVDDNNYSVKVVDNIELSPNGFPIFLRDFYLPQYYYIRATATTGTHIHIYGVEDNAPPVNPTYKMLGLLIMSGFSETLYTAPSNLKFAAVSHLTIANGLTEGTISLQHVNASGVTRNLLNEVTLAPNSLYEMWDFYLAPSDQLLISGSVAAGVTVSGYEVAL